MLTNLTCNYLNELEMQHYQLLWSEAVESLWDLKVIGYRDKLHPQRFHKNEVLYWVQGELKPQNSAMQGK